MERQQVHDPLPDGERAVERGDSPQIGDQVVTGLLVKVQRLPARFEPVLSLQRLVLSHPEPRVLIGRRESVGRLGALGLDRSAVLGVQRERRECGKRQDQTGRAHAHNSAPCRPCPALLDGPVSSLVARDPAPARTRAIPSRVRAQRPFLLPWVMYRRLRPDR